MKLSNDSRSGNEYKTRFLLAHLEQPYQYIPIDMLRGESRTQEFLQKNLNGRIPVLELDDGSYLPESNAILYSFCKTHQPEDRFEQAQVMQWLFFVQYRHEPNSATPRFWLAFKGFEKTPFNLELLWQKQKAGNQALGVMNEHLESH